MSKTSRPDPAQFPSLAENYLGEGVTPGQISGDGFSMKRGGGADCDRWAGPGAISQLPLPAGLPTVMASAGHCSMVLFIFGKTEKMFLPKSTFKSPLYGS